ncbi:MAG: hypothetical protein ACJAZH_001574 [Roseivirga sp.]|jgi:uncharacterized protein (DUF2237 family)
MQKNVFGESLIACSSAPLTGYFRDGHCHTDDSDFGVHAVCAVLTDEFLKFSKEQGNDLSTPMPQYNFPGLNAGDRWCVCAARWIEAFQANCAPFLVLEACHEKLLEHIPLQDLVHFAHVERE